MLRIFFLRNLLFLFVSLYRNARTELGVNLGFCNISAIPNITDRSVEVYGVIKGHTYDQRLYIFYFTSYKKDIIPSINLILNNRVELFFSSRIYKTKQIRLIWMKLTHIYHLTI